MELDLRALLLSNGIAVRSSATDRSEITICCPFCLERGETADTRFRLGINVSKNVAHCYNCRWATRHAAQAILSHLRITRQGLSAGFYNDATDEKKEPPVQLPEDYHCLTSVYDDMDREARQYVLQRGISMEQIKHYHIGVSFSGRFAYRIVFPIYCNKQLKSLVTRDFTGRQKPKYLNSVSDKPIAYFKPDAPRVILSEGVFKAMRIQRVTGDCSASLLGHTLTEQQLQQIQESKCSEIVLWPDPDPPGYRGIVTVADKLREEWKGRVKIVCGNKRPADEVGLNSLQNAMSNVRDFDWSTRAKLLLY